MKVTPLLILLLGSLFFVACQPDNGDLNDPNNNTPPDINEGDAPINNDPETIEIGELGRLLFYDPILSGGQDVSCATCHHPNFGYADGRALSIGIDGTGLGPNRTHNSAAQEGFVRRNSPTIINTAFNGMDEDGHYIPADAPMFWDNRLRSLEAQALGPIESFEEMRGHAFEEDVAVESIVARLQNNAEYTALFTSAFGNNNPVNSDNIGRAIATFERMITATNSPFDQFQAGDQDALNQQQLRGMNRFNQVGCDDCHSGPMFSDFELHTLGVPDNNLLDSPDEGANGTYSFRTPTLRNLDETGPYFHNGVGANLEQTIRFYITARNAANNNGGGGNGGGGANGLNINPNVDRQDIDPDVRNLGNFNNNDIDDIIAFIEALNDPNFDREIPTSVPSGLPVGGNID